MIRTCNRLSKIRKGFFVPTIVVQEFVSAVHINNQHNAKELRAVLLSGQVLIILDSYLRLMLNSSKNLIIM
jgi:hypothetical protein